MGLIGDNCLTLYEWGKRLDPDGSLPQIVEGMSKTNQALEDMLWVEGNLPTGHRTTVRNGLPTVGWRSFNEGVAPSKSTTVQVDDVCGLMEAWSQVDEDLMALNGNDPGFRLSEELPFIEAMNQDVASGLFYFNIALTPKKFHGLASRYNTLASGNVINAGGSGSDTTSAWLIVWGPNTCHGIFPKGSKAGYVQEDLGLITVDDGNTPTGKYRAWQTHWKWKPGLCLRDWRYVVRIANIESTGTTNIIDPEMFVDAYYALPTTDVLGGRAAIYCNKTVMAQISKTAMNKNNGYFTVENIFGKPVTTFWGIPIRRVDAILNTETALV